MRRRDKLYIGISILMALATLGLFLPEPFIYFIWGEPEGHLPPSRIIFFALLSLILGISGLVLIVLGLKRKEAIKTLLTATLITNFFIIALFLKLAGII